MKPTNNTKRPNIPAAFVIAIAPPQKSNCGGELVVLELSSQGDLLDLAGRGQRYFGHKGDIVRGPPLGDLAFEELEDLVLCDIGAGLADHDQERPLVPFGM